MVTMEIVYEIHWMERRELDGPFCDYCGKPIDVFPCPVLTRAEGKEPHALCSKCREKSAIDEGDNEYFESLSLQEGREPFRRKVNFGGRRKPT